MVAFSSRASFASVSNIHAPTRSSSSIDPLSQRASSALILMFIESSNALNGIKRKSTGCTVPLDMFPSLEWSMNVKSVVSTFAGSAIRVNDALSPSGEYVNGSTLSTSLLILSVQFLSSFSAPSKTRAVNRPCEVSTGHNHVTPVKLS